MMDTYFKCRDIFPPCKQDEGEEEDEVEDESSTDETSSCSSLWSLSSPASPSSSNFSLIKRRRPLRPYLTMASRADFSNALYKIPFHSTLFWTEEKVISNILLACRGVASDLFQYSSSPPPPILLPGYSITSLSSYLKNISSLFYQRTVLNAALNSFSSCQDTALSALSAALTDLLFAYDTSLLHLHSSFSPSSSLVSLLTSLETHRHYLRQLLQIVTIDPSLLISISTSSFQADSVYLAPAYWEAHTPRSWDLLAVIFHKFDAMKHFTHTSYTVPLLSSSPMTSLLDPSFVKTTLLAYCLRLVSDALLKDIYRSAFELLPLPYSAISNAGLLSSITFPVEALELTSDPVGQLKIMLTWAQGRVLLLQNTSREGPRTVQNAPLVDFCRDQNAVLSFPYHEDGLPMILRTLRAAEKRVEQLERVIEKYMTEWEEEKVFRQGNFCGNSAADNVRLERSYEEATRRVVLSPEELLKPSQERAPAKQRRRGHSEPDVFDVDGKFILSSGSITSRLVERSLIDEARNEILRKHGVRMRAVEARSAEMEWRQRRLVTLPAARLKLAAILQQDVLNWRASRLSPPLSFVLLREGSNKTNGSVGESGRGDMMDTKTVQDAVSNNNDGSSIDRPVAAYSTSTNDAIEDISHRIILPEAIMAPQNSAVLSHVGESGGRLVFKDVTPLVVMEKSREEGGQDELLEKEAEVMSLNGEITKGEERRHDAEQDLSTRFVEPSGCVPETSPFLTGALAQSASLLLSSDVYDLEGDSYLLKAFECLPNALHLFAFKSGLAKEFSLHKHDTSGTLKERALHCSEGMAPLLRRSLLKAVQMQCRALDQALLLTTLREGKLLDHITSIEDTFLLSPRSAFLSALVAAVVESPIHKVHSVPTTQHYQKVWSNQVFDAVIKKIGTPFPAEASFSLQNLHNGATRNNNQTQTHSCSFEELTDLEINYDAPWPLSFIITKSSMASVSLCTRRLLALLHVRHISQLLWRDLKPYSSRSSQIALDTPAHKELYEAFHHIVRTLEGILAFHMESILQMQIRFRDRLKSEAVVGGFACLAVLFQQYAEDLVDCVYADKKDAPGSLLSYNFHILQ